jgi:3-oxoacyl-[acyl-carrier protein] reductase
VAICARNPEPLAHAADALRRHGGLVYTEALDVADGPAYRRFIAAAAEAMGGLDIFVHNASAMGGPATDDAGWERGLAVDILAATRGVEAALPYLEQSPEGCILFNATAAAVEAYPTVFPEPGRYGPLKAALLKYANELAHALGPKGIRVNAVSPGVIFHAEGPWDRVQRARPQHYEHVLTQIALRRAGTPEEAARVFAFLASPAAGFVSGVNVLVDGGAHRSLG